MPFSSHSHEDARNIYCQLPRRMSQPIYTFAPKLFNAMEILTKLVWVVNELNEAGDRGLSLKELNKRWQDSYQSDGKPIPRQTFTRWKDTISSTFGISIKCSQHPHYRYYIPHREFPKEETLRCWLLDTYSTYNALSQHLAIQDRILVEEIPSNRDFLTDILTAMHRGKVIEIDYQNFTGGELYTHRVAPYCLKMFMRCWYLLARNTYNDQLRIYGLDRIEGLEMTDETFQLPENFDANDYFSTFFGVVHDEDIPVETIVIRAKGSHRKYLNSLPLHHSQHMIFQCDDYADFELRLRPTYDFCFELLRYGEMIEVLRPQTLRHTMHEYAQELWDMYKGD